MSDEKTAITAPQYFNSQAWIQMKEMAGTFIKSQAIPPYYRNVEQVVTALQTGYEMGMKPMESLKSFYIINGILTLYGAATIKRLRDHGWQIHYDDSASTAENGGTCTATISKGKEKYTETFTFKQAEMSGYTKTASGQLKPGWIGGQNRRLKLRYGVISMLIKTYVPEVLGSAVDLAEVAEDYQIKNTPDLPPVEEAETVDGPLPEAPPELPKEK